MKLLKVTQDLFRYIRNPLGHKGSHKVPENPSEMEERRFSSSDVSPSDIPLYDMSPHDSSPIQHVYPLVEIIFGEKRRKEKCHLRRNIFPPFLMGFQGP